ncbi:MULTISPECIES: CheR family methyltransferase [Kosakonia]|uniref:CheR family methyltransferase n=1 Tax=Kosakonia TaxID=1330547 RepID=UPI00201DF548|nr:MULTISPECIES: CheR family methyltransferase [Kosakonia]MCL6744376.1 methyltransferase domain-containing protein [Kosakonia sp. R1.Fl]MDZ7323041.1 methyltransferase domain-containing protein [Kosakonia sacchari]
MHSITPHAPQAPIVLTESELEKISKLIYQRAGIVLTAQKRDMVYNRLSRRLRELNLKGFEDYTDRLVANPGSDEWQVFVNALTTNLTSFFREAYHFPTLARHAQSRNGMYNVWCAAASTGEEPWSIAMTLEETLGRSITGPRVLATDIDTDVLEKASLGVYRLSDIDNLSEQQKRTWFLRGTGEHQSRVKIKSELRSTVQFRQLNLIDAQWDIPAPFDAIFCRNVMIYFDQNTQEKLLQRFAKMLKPGGLLFVGHSEHFQNLTSPFRLLGQSVYRLGDQK